MPHTQSPRFFLSSNPESLKALAPDVTIEAEYGDVTVKGRMLTMAHHGKNAGNMAPCAYDHTLCRDLYLDSGDVETVGLSHIDLDTIGGCMAVVGNKPKGSYTFWQAAEFVDLNGPHRLHQYSGLTPKVIDQLNAWWAWSEGNRTYAPRDGSLLEVTTQVGEAMDALLAILAGDQGAIDAGRAWAKRQDGLNAISFQSITYGVILRDHPSFTNHLYTTPGNQVGVAVVAFNPEHASVTLSFEDELPASGVTARALVQELWGELAGGHDTIAGSPRGRAMTKDDAFALLRRVVAEYSA